MEYFLKGQIDKFYNWISNVVHGALQAEEFGVRLTAETFATTNHVEIASEVGLPNCDKLKAERLHLPH